MAVKRRNREQLVPLLKWVVYALLLVLFYTVQTTPRLFAIAGIKPVWIVPLCLSVCMFEDVLPASLYATVGGLLWDISSDKLFGFTGVILLCCGAAVALLCVYYLRPNLPGILIFCLMTILLRVGLEFLFYYVLLDYAHSGQLFVRQVLPSLGYTLLVTAPVYWLVKWLSTRFSLNVKL